MESKCDVKQELLLLVGAFAMGDDGALDYWDPMLNPAGVKLFNVAGRNHHLQCR